MGLISGFVGGVGRGAAQAGAMVLSDKLAKERDEANFLRDSQLRTDLQSDRHQFLSDSQSAKLQSDNERAAFTAEKAGERSVASDASRSATAKADREARSADSKYVVDNKAPKNAQTISIDGGNGLVVDAILNDDGSYSVPIENGSTKSVTPSVKSTAAAADEWAKLEEGNTNMVGLGGKSGAEEASGMKKADFLAKRAIEIELGTGGAGSETKATPTPDTAPKADAAPASTKSTVTPDKWYADMMADGLDPTKAAAAVAKKHPEWKGPEKESSLMKDLSPVGTASASTGVINSQTGDDGMIDDLVDGTEKPIIPAKAEAEPEGLISKAVSGATDYVQDVADKSVQAGEAKRDKAFNEPRWETLGLSSPPNMNDPATKEIISNDYESNFAGMAPNDRASWLRANKEGLSKGQQAEAEAILAADREADKEPSLTEARG
jgi:hypothetical protein